MPGKHECGKPHREFESRPFRFPGDSPFSLSKGAIMPPRGNLIIIIKRMAKSNSAFMKPMNVSDDLAEVVGKGPMPRSEVVKKLWVYIKKEGLQDQIKI